MSQTLSAVFDTSHETNFRLNIPWLRTLVKVFSATNVQKQAATILSRNLLQRNARRQQTRGTSLPLRKRGLLLSFRSASRSVELFPLPESMLNKCQLITKHIDDIEALGDIGSMNVEAISKALSKNRGLSVRNDFYCIPFLTWSVELPRMSIFSMILGTLLLPCLMPPV
jgi:hypothetical protein